MHVDTFKQDILYTLRRLRRDAGFFAAAVLIIGLGVGANTAIFSVVNALLFRPLQFNASSRLVWIANTGTGLSGVTSRVASYQGWQRLNKSMESMAAYFAFFDYGTYTLAGVGEPERLVGVGVSQNFIPFLGVQPELGRNFSDEECKWNGAPAVILTHGLWERRFGSDPHIASRSITLNDKPTVVAGVLPASFDFSTVFTPGSRVDMIVPFPITPETDRYGNTLAVLGRLKPNVSVQRAQAEFDVMNDQLRRENRNWWTFGAKLTPLQDQLTSRFRRGLFVLCAVGAVLLIACTNLSNLMLARAASRRKEMAIRSALGASRARLVRQMLTESLVLSLFGALAGLGIGYLGIRSLTAIRGVSIPLLHTVKMDGTALLFTLVAALATGFLFGIVPALQTAGSNESESLKDTGRGLSEGRRTAWTRSVLVVSEVALACMLLVGAGLLIRSFVRVLKVDLGFQPEQAASWRIDTGDRYNNKAAELNAFYDRLVRSVEALPGVESVGITDALPLSRDRSWGARARGVNYPKGQEPIAHPRLVDWHYLKTMRIPFVAGRDFTEHDTDTSEKVMIVNEKMARQVWPNQNPIGQIALVNGDRHVVGVVANVRHQSLEEEGGLEMYIPLKQMRSGSVELVVRTKLSPDSLAPSVRSALRAVEPTLPTAEYQELGELVDRAVSPRRFMMVLLGAFAVAALLLASIGIYGVVSYTVSQRTAEIGIRMALGASAGQVQRHVMRETVTLVGSGIVIGIVGALILARLTASLLYQLEPTDPLTFVITVAVLLIVAVSTGYLPALRASRVDPMSALRTS
jgi:putative ABC transport system permease protein